MPRRSKFWGWVLVGAGIAGCTTERPVPMSAPDLISDSREAAAPSAAQPPHASAEDAVCVLARRAMVADQLRLRGIQDRRVLNVMGRVPRQQFVPPSLRSSAYDDDPLPIGHGQTISQPYIVALMTELVRPQPGDRALDIGTGCGYQAAVLAELVDEVYSIEIVDELATEARERLTDLGYRNVQVRSGDGYQGWKEHAPFQIIVVAAAPDHVPQPLIEQLATGGRLVIPVGKWFQNLLLLEKQSDGSVRETSITPVRFVPMTGEALRQ